MYDMKTNFLPEKNVMCDHSCIKWKEGRISYASHGSGGDIVPYIARLNRFTLIINAFMINFGEKIGA